MKFIIEKNTLRQLDEKAKLSGETVYTTEYIDENAILNGEKVTSEGVIEILNQDYGEAKFLLQDALFGQYWTLGKKLIAGLFLLIILFGGYFLGGMGKYTQDNYNTALEAEKIRLENTSPIFLVEAEKIRLEEELEVQKQKIIQIEQDNATNLALLRSDQDDRIKQSENMTASCMNELQACNKDKSVAELEITKNDNYKTSLENNTIELQAKISMLEQEIKKIEDSSEFEKYVGMEVIKSCEKTQTQMCKDLYFNFRNNGFN